MKPLACSLFLGLTLFGCSVGPDYCPPEICLSDEFSSCDLSVDVAVPEQPLVAWWEVFEDPLLTNLI